eukprot:Lankesteria_metandrocarpae@DN1436_c0_g1_i1.p1
MPSKRGDGSPNTPGACGTPRHRSFLSTGNNDSISAAAAAAAANNNPTAVACTSGHSSSSNTSSGGASAASSTAASAPVSAAAALGLRPIQTRQVPSFASSTTNSRINNSFNTAAQNNVYMSSAGSNSSSGSTGNGRCYGAVLGGNTTAAAYRSSPATAAGTAAVRRATELNSAAATSYATSAPPMSSGSSSNITGGLHGRCPSPRFTFTTAEATRGTNSASSRNAPVPAPFSIMAGGVTPSLYRNQFRTTPQQLPITLSTNYGEQNSSTTTCAAVEREQHQPPAAHHTHTNVISHYNHSTTAAADRPLSSSAQEPMTSGLLVNNTTSRTGHDPELAAELDDMILGPLLASWSATTAANNQNNSINTETFNNSRPNDATLSSAVLMMSENIEGMLGQQLTKKSAKGLAADLISFVQKQLDRDVKVVCEDRTFAINSVVLSARSPVFHRMLQSEFVEGKSKVIKITDTNPYVVENFVDALTCDSCAILRDTTSNLKLLVQLYLLSDRYEFTSLTKRCESRLWGLMRKESALDVLDAVEITQSTMLKRRCMEMLQRYRGAELLSILRGHDLWSELRNMRVTIETNYSGGGGPRKAEVKCCDHDTIAVLKRIVSGVWPLRVECQRLIFQGKLLEDERTVSECGIEAGCVIFVMELSTRRMGKNLQKTPQVSSTSPISPTTNNTSIANPVNSSVEPRQLTLRNHRLGLGGTTHPGNLDDEAVSQNQHTSANAVGGSAMFDAEAEALSAM